MKAGYLFCIFTFCLILGCNISNSNKGEEKDKNSPKEFVADPLSYIPVPEKISLHSNPKVGQWAQWRTMGAANTTYKYSIVGSEGYDYWVEREDEAYIIKMLVSSDGNVKKAYIGKPGERGREAKIKRTEGDKKELGTEFISVSAGPFTCKKSQTTSSTAGATLTKTHWYIQGGEFDGIMVKEVTVMSYPGFTPVTSEQELLTIDKENVSSIGGNFLCIKLVYRTTAGENVSKETSWRSNKIYFDGLAKLETSTGTTELIRIGDQGAQSQLRTP